MPPELALVKLGRTLVNDVLNVYSNHPSCGPLPSHSVWISPSKARQASWLVVFELAAATPLGALGPVISGIHVPLPVGISHVFVRLMSMYGPSGRANWFIFQSNVSNRRSR